MLFKVLLVVTTGAIVVAMSCGLKRKLVNYCHMGCELVKDTLDLQMPHREATDDEMAHTSTSPGL